LVGAERAQLCATQREADRVIGASVKMPGRPDGFTRRLDRVVLHPLIGLGILLVVLFLMFQAVFTWAVQAPIDPDQERF
jgi:ferrous iron transport protein B